MRLRVAVRRLRHFRFPHEKEKKKGDDNIADTNWIRHFVNWPSYDRRGLKVYYEGSLRERFPMLCQNTPGGWNFKTHTNKIDV